MKIAPGGILRVAENEQITIKIKAERVPNRAELGPLVGGKWVEGPGSSGGRFQVTDPFRVKLRVILPFTQDASESIPDGAAYLVSFSGNQPAGDEWGDRYGHISGPFRTFRYRFEVGDE